MNSLQNFYIYSETIRNNQINEGSNKIYNVLTPHENDRRRLSARALPLTPQMVAGKHHFGPNSDPQFPDRNSKRKIKKMPRRVQYIHKTKNSSTMNCDCSTRQLEVGRKFWDLYFIYLYIYIYISF